MKCGVFCLYHSAELCAALCCDVRGGERGEWDILGTFSPFW